MSESTNSAQSEENKPSILAETGKTISSSEFEDAERPSDPPPDPPKQVTDPPPPPKPNQQT